MLDSKVLREALGIGAIGLAAVIVGALLSAAGNRAGAAVMVVGALVLAFCLAVLAYELLRRD